MMKVAQINSVCDIGSTGKICVSISKMLSNANIENVIYFFSGKSDYQLSEKFSKKLYIKIQALKSRIFGNYGFNSQRATQKLIKRLDAFKPDIIHIHNIHGHDVNIELLFDYIREKKIKTVWTLHDCWPFTAYCPHFTMAKCDKWKTGCFECPQRSNVSWFFDKSKENFLKKKEAVKGLNLTIITPSQWLADLVKQSFLKNYPVKVINNGIDLSIFKPTESNFKKRYNISQDKLVLLGVAFGWGKRKGLDVFVELSKRLPNEYQIVLVGTDDKVDKQLPNNILSIHRTQNQTELAEIYTAADLFVNPTREENYPTVNMEAIACGTPVISFNTGGSAEIIDDAGYVVEHNTVDELCEIIIKNKNIKSDMIKICLDKAKRFDKNKCFANYLKLYREVVE